MSFFLRTLSLFIFDCAEIGGLSLMAASRGSSLVAMPRLLLCGAQALGHMGFCG